jgi:hypothetical protein
MTRIDLPKGERQRNVWRMTATCRFGRPSIWSCDSRPYVGRSRDISVTRCRTPRARGGRLRRRGSGPAREPQAPSCQADAVPISAGRERDGSVIVGDLIDAQGWVVVRMQSDERADTVDSLVLRRRSRAVSSTGTSPGAWALDVQRYLLERADSFRSEDGSDADCKSCILAVIQPPKQVQIEVVGGGGGARRVTGAIKATSESSVGRMFLSDGPPG